MHRGSTGGRTLSLESGQENDTQDDARDRGILRPIQGRIEDESFENNRREDDECIGRGHDRDRRRLPEGNLRERQGEQTQRDRNVGIGVRELGEEASPRPDQGQIPEDQRDTDQHSSHPSIGDPVQVVDPAGPKGQDEEGTDQGKTDTHQPGQGVTSDRFLRRPVPPHHHGTGKNAKRTRDLHSPDPLPQNDGSEDDQRKHNNFVQRMVSRGYTEKQVRLLSEWYLRVRKAQ